MKTKEPDMIVLNARNQPVALHIYVQIGSKSDSNRIVTAEQFSLKELLPEVITPLIQEADPDFKVPKITLWDVITGRSEEILIDFKTEYLNLIGSAIVASCKRVVRDDFNNNLVRRRK
jgi:hypothetical protein